MEFCLLVTISRFSQIIILPFHNKRHKVPHNKRQKGIQHKIGTLLHLLINLQLINVEFICVSAHLSASRAEVWGVWKRYRRWCLLSPSSRYRLRSAAHQSAPQRTRRTWMFHFAHKGPCFWNVMLSEVTQSWIHASRQFSSEPLMWPNTRSLHP